MSHTLKSAAVKCSQNARKQWKRGHKAAAEALFPSATGQARPWEPRGELREKRFWSRYCHVNFFLCCLAFGQRTQIHFTPGQLFCTKTIHHYTSFPEPRQSAQLNGLQVRSMLLTMLVTYQSSPRFRTLWSACACQTSWTLRINCAWRRYFEKNPSQVKIFRKLCVTVTVCAVKPERFLFFFWLVTFVFNVHPNLYLTSFFKSDLPNRAA